MHEAASSPQEAPAWRRREQSLWFPSQLELGPGSLPVALPSSLPLLLQAALKLIRDPNT